MKTILLAILAPVTLAVRRILNLLSVAVVCLIAALTACGGAPSAVFIQPHLPSDYGLDCNGILREVSNLEITIRHETTRMDDWLHGDVSTQIVQEARNRMQNLRTLGASKDCFNKQPSGASTETQQPASAPPKEKSRVIVCNEGQTCIVE